MDPPEEMTMRKWFPAVLTVIAFGISIAVYSQLPDHMAIHWGMDGRANGWADRPFGAFMLGLQNAYRNPVGRALVGGLLARIAGMEPRFMEQLTTDAEMDRARKMSFDELADDALLAKETN